MSRWCDRSIYDAEHSGRPNGRSLVVKLFGTRVAETILASVHVRAHQKAGHMDASDLIKSLPDILRGGARPHMGSRSWLIHNIPAMISAVDQNDIGVTFAASVPHLSIII
jgi:hypothetical protein